MDVGVEHLLERGFAISQKQVDPVAWQPGRAKRCGQPRCYRVQMQKD